MTVWKRGYPKGMNPQIEKLVPWKRAVPIALHNEVSGKGNKSQDVICLEEIALMFTCLKNNDFKDSICLEEMKKYHNCVFNHMAAKEELKRQIVAGKLTPNKRGEPAKLNHRQLNMLLKKYPQYNYQDPKK